MSPDTAAAARILAANAHKPVRVLTPSDFYAPKPGRIACLKERVRDSKKSERTVLAEKCERLLRKRGALSTVQLTAHTGEGWRRVAWACRIIPGIQVDEIKLRSGSRGKIWMVPASQIGDEAAL